MKKSLIGILIFLIATTLNSCNSKPIVSSSKIETSTVIDKEEDDSYMNKTLILKIDNKEVNVSWMDNDSVKELKKLSLNTLTITLNKYGNFEQFGSIGHTIISNDKNMSTNAGDIMLYQSDKIVLFYGTNTYSYTKLGHINLNESELKELLGKNDSVTITLCLS